jgi:hypothetical protein
MLGGWIIDATSPRLMAIQGDRRDPKEIIHGP